MDVIDRGITDEMRTSYMAYAMAVLTDRALPDVRDGLKPVHRRVLYAMHELGNRANGPHKKSARIVGDVLGKYHPHGDTAAYDAIVRMAQDFSLRYPLVDGQGNFGSVDGDNAAAMRYTEIRLSKIASDLLSDLDYGVVDTKNNYDGSEQEPVVLPSAFPNLLVNGSEGIAVGMATKIPPHYLPDTVAAIVAQINNPGISNAELADILVAPDFPTGGIICGTDGARQAYITGKGSVVIRAAVTLEENDNHTNVVFTQLPYQVNKARLLEKVGELVRSGDLPDIADIRDESDKSGMRGVLRLKRGSNPEIALNRLYSLTQLQVSYHINLVALVDNVPQQLTLRDMIDAYIKHRRDVVWRRTESMIAALQKKLELLDGRIGALIVLQLVIKIITGSKTIDEARTKLRDSILAIDASGNKYPLSAAQVADILAMPLSKLVGMEQQALRDEQQNTNKEIINLTKIITPNTKLKRSNYKQLTDDEFELKIYDNLNNAIVKELNGVVLHSDRYHTALYKRPDVRRTMIAPALNSVTDEDLITPKDVVVTLTADGYIKRTELSEYRTQSRGGRGKAAAKPKAGDTIVSHLVANAHDQLYMFTSRGRVYTPKVYILPEGDRGAKGKPVINVVKLSECETVMAMMRVTKEQRNDPSLRVVFTSRNGYIKQVSLSSFNNVRELGINALDVADDDYLVGAELMAPGADIIMVSAYGMAVRFNESTVRVSKRTSGMMRGMTLKPGDVLVSMQVCTDDNAQVLVVSSTGVGKITSLGNFRSMTNRGGRGVKASRRKDNDEKLVAVLALNKETTDVTIISKNGVMVRIPVAEIRTTDRTARGVKLISLDDNDVVVSATLTD